MKGIIALDIDGTLTSQIHHIPEEVIKFLENLTFIGWKLIFITGRPFQWGYSTLNSLQCSYYLAVQNGALILEMPKKIIKLKKYLHADILPGMDLICRSESSHYVIYSGYENKDIGYFRPSQFNPLLLEFLLKRVRALDETWMELNSFDNLPIKEWASVKSFGYFESANRIARRIENELQLHAPMIKDPIDSNFYVVQATHHDVDKGKTVQEFSKLIGKPPIIIAAGDDNNDISMLAVSDIKIVMETAPTEILEMADIIAPAASKHGIITGLSEALKRVK